MVVTLCVCVLKSETGQYVEEIRGNEAQQHDDRVAFNINCIIHCFQYIYIFREAISFILTKAVARKVNMFVVVPVITVVPVIPGTKETE